jgi:chromosomal replication initiator protein
MCRHAFRPSIPHLAARHSAARFSPLSWFAERAKVDCKLRAPQTTFAADFRIVSSPQRAKLRAHFFAREAFSYTRRGREISRFASPRFSQFGRSRRRDPKHVAFLAKNATFRPWFFVRAGYLDDLKFDRIRASNYVDFSGSARHIFPPVSDLPFRTDGAAVQNEVFVIPMPRVAVANASDSPLGEGLNGAPLAADRANRGFVVGPENRLTGHVVRWLINRSDENYSDKNGGGESYSPVVVQGPTGSGKSHLADAVAHSQTDVVCTSGAEFAREFAAALDNHAIEAFRQRYRGCGMLVFEDLNQLASRRPALDELQNTLDELEARETPVLITTRVSPKEINGISPQLVNRLQGGLSLTLATPGPEARLTILEQLAASREVRWTAEAAELLAVELVVAAPALKAALFQLEQAAREIGSTTIEVEHVQQYLAAQRKAAQPSVKEITAAVAKCFGLKPAVLGQASRRRQVVLARSIAIYLSRKFTGQSLQALGKQFGGRDHTTVMHSIRTVEERMEADEELRNMIAQIEQKLIEQQQPV